MESKTRKVVASGVLKVFNELPCYVLDDGQRVFRLSNLTRALRGQEHGSHGKFGNYLAASNIEPYLPDRLKPLKDEHNDRVPQGILEFEFNGKIEKGYNSEDFMDVCTAFVEASMNNEKLSEAQVQIIRNANRFILACAKIGITALVDEATGYQEHRASDALQLKLNFFLADEKRDWEKTFPDELWVQFGRLTKWKGNIKQRPKYWGKLVNEFIYDCLDQDLSNYLKKNKPLKPSHIRYHQWLNEDRGVKALIQHIWQIIGMARTCSDIKDLRTLVNKEFHKKPAQLGF